MSDSTPPFRRLDAADVTDTERAIVRQLRTDSGWWNGDDTALRILRQYEITRRPKPPALPQPFADGPSLKPWICCPKCGSDDYPIVKHTGAPFGDCEWRECPECGHKSEPS